MKLIEEYVPVETIARDVSNNIENGSNRFFDDTDSVIKILSKRVKELISEGMDIDKAFDEISSYEPGIDYQAIIESLREDYKYG